jgi:hypothetical protein
VNSEAVVRWYLKETSGNPAGSLASVVPKSFPAVARVLNPVTTPGGRNFRWSEISGPELVVDSETQWSDIVAASHPDPNQYYEPETGTIDRGVATLLCALLTEHTQSSMCTYFAWKDTAR